MQEGFFLCSNTQSYFSPLNTSKPAQIIKPQLFHVCFCTWGRTNPVLEADTFPCGYPEEPRHPHDAK